MLLPMREQSTKLTYTQKKIHNKKQKNDKKERKK